MGNKFLIGVALAFGLGLAGMLVLTLVISMKHTDVSTSEASANQVSTNQPPTNEATNQDNQTPQTPNQPLPTAEQSQNQAPTQNSTDKPPVNPSDLKSNPKSTSTNIAVSNTSNINNLEPKINPVIDPRATDSEAPVEIATNTDAVPNQIPKKRIYIVIDDVGYNIENVKKYLNVKIPLTFSIIPRVKYTNASVSLIENSIKKSEKNNAAPMHEIIIHQPMESHNYPKLEDSGVKLDFSDDQVIDIINQNIADFKGIARGMNNHMGSSVTENEHIISLVINEVEKHGMYFLDSYTTPYSKVSLYSKNYHKRDVFLDNETSYEYIKGQFEVGLNKLKNQDDLVMIGHTASDNLIRYILDNQDVLMQTYQFLTLSSLFANQNANQNIKFPHQNIITIANFEDTVNRHDMSYNVIPKEVSSGAMQGSSGQESANIEIPVPK